VGYKQVSIVERINQLNTFYFLHTHYLLFGVGINNSVPAINIFENVAKRVFVLQPIHNIFLLLVSEIGILGLMLVIWLLTKIKWNNLRKWDWVILGIIFMTGMVDHYWFTLPQNMWLLALVLGLV
jgi:hypothetical protein